MSSEKILCQFDVISCIVELPTGVNRHTISNDLTGGRSSDMENCRVTDVPWAPIRGLLETVAIRGTAAWKERGGDWVVMSYFTKCKYSACSSQRTWRFAEAKSEPWSLVTLQVKVPSSEGVMSRTVSLLMVEVVMMSYLLVSVRIELSKFHWNVGTGSASAAQVKVALLPTSACVSSGAVVITEAAVGRQR